MPLNKTKTLIEIGASLKEFGFKDQGSFIAFSKNLPVHADLSFNNLMSWMSLNTPVRFKRINGNYVFLFDDFTRRKPTKSLTVVGRSRVVDTWHKMKDLQSELSDYYEIHVGFNLVPDYFVAPLLKQLDEPIFTEDRSNDDYILSVDKLISMRGKQFAEFRHQVNYFIKNYGQDCLITDIPLDNPRARLNLINQMHLWDRQTTYLSNDKLKNEAKVIEKRLLAQSSLQLKHYCVGVSIDGQIVGISIYHIDTKGKMAIGSHLKFNPIFKRMFDFLVFVTATRLKAMGIELLNSEQDLGIAGIRKHKLSYNPVDYYKKYSAD